MRGLTVLALVRVLPVEEEETGRFGVLVFARDLWSLRLEQRIQVTGSHLDRLLLQLSEYNLFGEAVLVTLRSDLLPRTLSVGEVFFDRRLFGRRLALTQTFDAILGRFSGEPEGASVSLALTRPFYDLEQLAGFDVAAWYYTGIERQLRGAEILTWDDPATNEQEAFGRVWHERFLAASAMAQLQIGRSFKHRFYAGAGCYLRDVEPNAETGSLGEHAAAFRDAVMPDERREIFPLLKYTMFTPRYVAVRDLGSFGVSETLRLGPSFSVLLKAPLELLGSIDDAFIADATLSYVIMPAGVLLDALVGASGRLRGGSVVDQVLSARVRGASPRTRAGRLVAYASWQGRRRDTSESLVTLGGDSGLRGYESSAFVGFGASSFKATVELRSRPLVWSSIHAGGLAFYDAGSVYEQRDEIKLHQSAGLGLRFLFPQLNRFVYRLDAGVPFDGEGFTVTLSFGNAQVVPMTPAEDAAAN